MAQSREQFAGEEERSNSKEDSMSLCRMNKLVAPVNSQYGVEHSYQLQELYHGGNGNLNDANQKERLLGGTVDGDCDSDVNGGCQLEESYKRDGCQEKSVLYNSPNCEETNEANKESVLFNGSCPSPRFRDTIKDNLYKGETMISREKESDVHSESSAESLSFSSTSPQETPAGICAGSLLEETKPSTGYDIQFDNQTNTDPRGLPPSPPSTSLSITEEYLTAGPHYRHITSPAERDSRPAANDIRDNDRLCKGDERETGQIESRCNSLEKVQEKKGLDCQLQIQKEQKQEEDLYLQEDQGINENNSTQSNRCLDLYFNLCFEKVQ